jgi:murein DD-endopeptidase MepM/ murein hydrolase activator NlpD
MSGYFFCVTSLRAFKLKLCVMGKLLLCRSRHFFVILFFIFLYLHTLSQPAVQPPTGGGEYKAQQHLRDEITPAQRAAIIGRLKQNETLLRQQGLLAAPDNTQATLLEWPLKQALNYNDPGYYGISNYIDEQPAYPNNLLDYNCGQRTYDVSSGYNHKGTDIFTWPYYWQKMERNAVQVIAGAAGTIIGKDDGNFDQNCSFCTGPCNWNAVYIQHADGSVAWYGHLKSGSLTTKTVGQTVVSGEYLGVVGSSGNSTGPHLHLELYTNSAYTQLVDPWDGPCNYLNGGTSWWANQQPYYVSTLNKLMTHGAAPSTGSCPASEIPNEKINFAPGETVFLGGYYRDQQSGQQSVHTLYRPDNTVEATWTQNFTTYYSASWWYYTRILSGAAPAGVWRYEVLYNGTQKATRYFSVGSAPVIVCPDNYNVLTSNLTGSSSYQWQVNTGSGFVNIANGLYYSGATTRTLQLRNIPSSFYGYQYRCLVDGSATSFVSTIKFTSYWQGGVNKAWENPSNWSCGNVPDANTDVVVGSSTNTPEVNSNASCRSLTLNNGANVTVKTGFKLTVVR